MDVDEFVVIVSAYNETNAEVTNNAAHAILRQDFFMILKPLHFYGCVQFSFRGIRTYISLPLYGHSADSLMYSFVDCGALAVEPSHPVGKNQFMGMSLSSRASQTTRRGIRTTNCGSPMHALRKSDIRFACLPHTPCVETLPKEAATDRFSLFRFSSLIRMLDGAPKGKGTHNVCHYACCGKTILHFCAT